MAVKVNIELIGNEEDVLSFVALCAKIHMMCSLGTSNTIPVVVDGDGSGDLRFKAIGELKDGPVDLIKSWKETFGSEFKDELEGEPCKEHYIGE